MSFSLRPSPYTSAVSSRVTPAGRGVQYRHGLPVIHLAPVGPELPGAEADDGYGPAGPAQNAMFHRT